MIDNTFIITGQMDWKQSVFSRVYGDGGKKSTKVFFFYKNGNLSYFCSNESIVKYLSVLLRWKPGWNVVFVTKPNIDCQEIVFNHSMLVSQRCYGAAISELRDKKYFLKHKSIKNVWLLSLADITPPSLPSSIAALVYLQQGSKLKGW